MTGVRVDRRELGGFTIRGQPAFGMRPTLRFVVAISLTVAWSDYVVDQLEQTPNIRIRLRNELIDGSGTGRLTAPTLRDNVHGHIDRVAADGCT